MKWVSFFLVIFSVSLGIDKLGYDFSSSVVIDLNNKAQLEAIGKALKVHDFLVDQVSLQRDLLKQKDKTIADIQRKQKFEKAMKITGIVLGCVGGFVAGFGLAYGISRLRK